MICLQPASPVSSHPSHPQAPRHSGLLYSPLCQNCPFCFLLLECSATRPCMIVSIIFLSHLRATSLERSSMTGQVKSVCQAIVTVHCILLFYFFLFSSWFPSEIPLFYLLSVLLAFLYNVNSFHNGVS